MAPIDDSLSGAVALAAAGDETAFARIIRAYHDDGGSDNAIVISCSSVVP